MSGNEGGWGTCHANAKLALLAILALFDPDDLVDISYIVLIFHDYSGILAGKEIHWPTSGHPVAYMICP